MSSDPVHPHATQLRNHWYWRPGWNPNRPFCTWHITFENQDELHRLVSTYQDALRAVPGLDFIPRRWLHLTMQGVGFRDEVQSAQMVQIVDAIRRRLTEHSPIELMFHGAVIRPEAIALVPESAQALVEIRNEVRAGIAEIWGSEGVPESESLFQPHLSLAYVNTDMPASTALQAINRVHAEPTTALVERVSLIELRRDQHLYRWELLATAEFTRIL